MIPEGSPAQIQAVHAVHRADRKYLTRFGSIIDEKAEYFLIDQKFESWPADSKEIGILKKNFDEGNFEHLASEDGVELYKRR
jgi:hypothetical protein